MNASEILRYGHLWVHQHLTGLSDEQWLTPGVCGVWSVKDIIAHLTSFEWLLVDVLTAQRSPGAPIPTRDQFTSMDGDSFNAVQVGRRDHDPASVVLNEYDSGYAQGMTLLQSLDPAWFSQPGTLPWYGAEYSLDDFIVYQFYGHKREHCAQIAVYREKIKQAAERPAPVV